MNNTIPPITDPLGKYWDQPDTSKILVDDTHAVMSQATFEQLAEYSTTNPSGVYHGKMWRRHDGAYDRRPNAPPPVWLLMWYGVDPDPAFVKNCHRKIIIA